MKIGARLLVRWHIAYRVRQGTEARCSPLESVDGLAGSYNQVLAGPPHHGHQGVGVGWCGIGGVATHRSIRLGCKAPKDIIDGGCISSVLQFGAYLCKRYITTRNRAWGLFCNGFGSHYRKRAFEFRLNLVYDHAGSEDNKWPFPTTFHPVNLLG